MIFSFFSFYFYSPEMILSVACFPMLYWSLEGHKLNSYKGRRVAWWHKVITLHLMNKPICLKDYGGPYYIMNTSSEEHTACDLKHL